MLQTLPHQASNHFPIAPPSASSPSSPTFPHSQSLSLNGAGMALALRPGTSVGHRQDAAIGLPTPVSASFPLDAHGHPSYLDYIKSWDDASISKWLTDDIHVPQYVDLFRQNDIRGNVLLDVDQTALKEMGVRSVGDRVKITVAIKTLRQRCVQSAKAERAATRTSPLSSSIGLPLVNGVNGTGHKRPGSRSFGRVPPPLHLSQSNTHPEFASAQAYQPSTTPSSSRTGSAASLLNAPSQLSSSTSPRMASPIGRTIPPPQLPPPRSQPPPPPSSPPSHRTGTAPSISTTAASPTRNIEWSGDYGLPRGPQPGNLGGASFGPRSSSASPIPSVPPGERKTSLPNPSTSRPSISQPRPSTGSQQHRKQSSVARPSTAGASYGHNQPLSSHPYASSSSPTSDAFTPVNYATRSSSSTGTPSTLLPSPAISNDAKAIREREQGYTVGRGGFARPTTPGGLVSAAGPIGSRGEKLDLSDIKKNTIKFYTEDGGSKMIPVYDCQNGREVLLRVLRKFGKAYDESEQDEWGVFPYTHDSQARMLTEAELFNISRDERAPERLRGLVIRPIACRIDDPKNRRDRKLAWMFGEQNTPDSSRPGGVVTPSSPNYLNVDIPSTSIEPASPGGNSVGSSPERAEIVRIVNLMDDPLGRSSKSSNLDRGKMNRASTVSILSSLGGEVAPSATRSPSSGSFLNSGQRKLRNFFGQRPPSELIATHLTEYFPKAEKKLMSKQVRQSMRKSMVRRASQASSIGYATSWERMPENRDSLSPAAMSRLSISSGGSGGSGGRTQSLAAPADISSPPPLPRTHSNDAKSTLEPPDESAEDDNGDDARKLLSAGLIQRRSSRVSTSSRLSSQSLWERRSKDSDAASMLTVDEVTAELESRRASMASLDDSDDDVSILDSVVSVDEEFDDELLEDEDESDDDEEEEEEPLQDPASQKPTIKWIRGALIGSGSFGSVYLGMDALSGSLMAVKQVELPTGNSHNEERKKAMLDALEREIELLKNLQHDNIVQYLDSSNDATHLNIFLEYVPGGSVAALLGNYGAFEEALVSKFCRQILAGLEYLHGREIIHRDIKGANILVDNKGGIKISDFGISKRVEDNLLSGAKIHRPSLQGSVYWMAPEVVKQTSYTSKADIWSLGCLVVEMLTGAHPWANLTQMQAIFRIGSQMRPTIPEDVSADAADFLDKTFQLDYMERPSAKELLQHPFIREDSKDLQTPTRATFSQNTSPTKEA